MKMRAYVGKTVAVMVLLAAAVLPALGQGVGAIGGTITDSSGAVLPGVTVTLTNTQGSVGGNQTTTADDRGNYQFIRLVPGTYTVTAELQGFRRAAQENIVVNSDNTSRADLRLAVGELSEQMTITAQAPLLDTTSAMKQTVLSREVLDAMPNRSDVWGIARVIPSVILSKVDVGGSESFLQSTATVHGSSNENGYLVDGMEVAAVTSNGSTAAIYLDPYAFQETNYQTSSGGTAISLRGGLQFNMITRTGTNKLHGGAMLNGANRSMGWNNFSPALKAQLLVAVPASALAANPNIKPGADILKIYDLGAWLGGPVVLDKLWFSGSFHKQVLNQYLAANYNPDGGQVLDDNLMYTTSAKLSWQATKNAQLSYFNYLQYKLIGHRNRVNTAFSDSAARSYNYKWPDVHQGKYTSPLGNHVVVDASWNHFNSDDLFGQRPEVKPGTIAKFDAVTNSFTAAAPTYNNNSMHRDQVLSSIGYFSGSHDIKAGYQFEWEKLDGANWSLSGMRAVYRSGVPDSVNTYASLITTTATKPPANFVLQNVAHGLYVQDKWTPTRKLTINVGLRLDTIFAWQQATCRPTNVFIGVEVCYPERRGVPDFKHAVPRFSGIYDVAGDGKTAIKFAAFRYNQPVTVKDVEASNPLGVVSDTRVWTSCAGGKTSACDLNGDLIPQLNELGPSNGYPSGNLSRYSPDLEWPISNEYSVEIQRQIPGNVVVSVGFTRREQRKNYGTTNLLVPTNTYIQLQVTEVNSGRQVTVFNQSPALRGQNDLLIDNSSAQDTNFNGWDITANKRMSDHWSLNAGASFGKAVGDIYGLSSDLNNPNFQFRRGLTTADVPWSYRLSGVFELPYEISASATAEWYQGFPELTTVSVGANTVALTQGTTNITVEPRGTTRLPFVSSLDASVRKSWKLPNGLKVQPRIDLYNISNQATILGRITQLGPTYGRANTIQRGRLIKLGVDIEF